MEPQSSTSCRLYHNQDWRAKTLVSYLAIIQLIAATTETGSPSLVQR